jgi:3-deoxy-manno-octulosonate cytidylyltransferase (CMP-KDO synthetase)
MPVVMAMPAPMSPRKPDLPAVLPNARPVVVNAVAAADFIVAIPARHASTRLPGKPLAALGGKPLVLHVAERALAAGAREVWVATDDARIAAALDGSGVRVAMTSAEHASGSDRLAECADIAGWDDEAVVVNLQGDEPFAPAAGIRAVAQALVASNAQMATLATAIDTADELFDPNVVKLVRSDAGLALYFSRAPIPWHRDGFARARDALPDGGAWWRHIGIYAYRDSAPFRADAARQAGENRVAGATARAGGRLRHCGGHHPEAFPPGIDTPEDLARAEAWLAGLTA